ncbi:MAG: hypothetical protein ACO1PN_15840 [Betaproteobacteria bacterium]
MKKTEELNPMLAPYLNNQSELSKARKHVAAIQSEIDKAANVGAAAVEGIPSAQTLDNELDDIEAALAMGQITEAEAKARRDSVNGGPRNAIADAELKATKAKRTRAGLERLLADAQAKVLALEVRERELFTEVMIAEAETSGEQYVKAAQEMIKHFLRLEYLAQLLKNSELGYARNIGTSYVRELFLPTFNVKALEGHYHQNRRHVFFDYMKLDYSGAFASAKLEEEQRLRSLGVNLPDPSIALAQWYRGPREALEAQSSATEGAAAEAA